jgi:hypothetical protein
VDQKRVSSSASVAGEAIAVMTWECMKYQVDIMCGDGNKAAYLATPGIGKHCVPSYQDSFTILDQQTCQGSSFLSGEELPRQDSMSCKSETLYLCII